MNSTQYINIDERYGDPVKVRLEDYQELNPEGEFTQDEDGIYESGVLIAEAVEESEDVNYNGVSDASSIAYLKK